MTPEFKREPWVAEARSNMAEVYRKVRKDSHTMARLLYRRQQAATKALAADLDRQLYFGGDNNDEFGKLFE